MSTTTAPQSSKGIFSGKGVNTPGKEVIEREMLRILFFFRIAQIEASTMGKSDLLSDDVRLELHTAAESIRKFDMKMRNRVDADKSKWLTQELRKDKLHDMSQLMEQCMKVSNDCGEQDYESFMSMMVTFFDKTLYLQASKTKINMNKYKAMFRFFTEEMRAEIEKGQTAVEYIEATDSLSFKLVQPDAQIPAKAV